MRPHPPAAGRIALLDWVKAAAIVNMVAYHALYDAAFLIGAAGVQAFMRSAPAHWWERCICSAFILVSGALALHSRRPYRRALAVFGAGLLITAVTLAFTPQLSGPCGASYRAGGACPAARAAVGGPCRLCGAVLADAHHPLRPMALGRAAAAGAV